MMFLLEPPQSRSSQTAFCEATSAPINMSDFEAAKQLPQPATPHNNFPNELCFERVVKNQTASPCSLSDFTLYLTHSENCPEVLQFFLWYWDYVQRWSQLLPRQKALSPAWDPEKAAEGPRASSFITYSHKRTRSLKTEKVLAVMEMDSRQSEQQVDNGVDMTRSRSSSASSTVTSARAVFSVPQQSQPKTPRTPSSVSGVLSPTKSIKSSSSWQPFTIQPNHPELTRVTKLFLSSPQTLKCLSQQDRESCLRAVQHTTHPTALLPAFMSVESTLRNLLHPAFIRHSLRNANAPRLIFASVVGITLILLGFVIQTILILSKQTPYLRVIVLILFWPGLTGVFAAIKGVDVMSHFKGRRQLRPWESASLPLFHEPSGDETKRGHERRDTTSTSGTASSTSPFTTPPDEKGQVGWEEQYKQRGWWDRVFDDTVEVESRPLIVMQDRIVFLSILWAGVLASALTVGVLFVPARGFF